MTKKEVIHFIERNPVIGKNLNKKEMDLLDGYYQKLTGKRIKDRGCYGCVLKAMDAVRRHAGYSPLKIKAHKQTTKERTEECNKCPYKEAGMLFDTCGPFLNKLRPAPKLTDKGVELCGCSIASKAELSHRWVDKLGGCPDKRWDRIK